MFYCNQCGKQLLSDWKYCTNCGYRIPRPHDSEPVSRTSLEMQTPNTNKDETGIDNLPIPPSAYKYYATPPGQAHSLNIRPERLTPMERISLLLLCLCLTVICIGLITMAISGSFSDDSYIQEGYSGGEVTALVFLATGSIIFLFSIIILAIAKADVLRKLGLGKGTGRYWKRLQYLSNGRTIDRLGMIGLGFLNFGLWAFVFTISCGIAILAFIFHLMNDEEYSKRKTIYGKDYRIYRKGFDSYEAQREEVWGLGERFPVKKHFDGRYYGIDPDTGEKVKLENNH
ncbi:MAG: zinc ribbon domain-containing protein [Actinobacteria bacterium]|nr:zinc ribbon domain-containing protein [Actinomycetota bacterium]